MENPISEIKIGLTQEAVAHLGKIRKWTMFFSILGFIALGILAIVGIAMIFIMPMLGQEGAMGPLSGIFLVIIYIIIAAIYFFPILYLYRFSVHVKSSLANSDANDLSVALKNLKDHYTFLGILTVVILAIYAIVLVVMLLGALLS